jgi:hypothetical protein
MLFDDLVPHYHEVDHTSLVQPWAEARGLLHEYGSNMDIGILFFSEQYTASVSVVH